ncbi:bile acid:sodium symporter [Flavobacterium sp. FZUC8N2.13]|uniref:Bile acid:sodium symporter n=1 Tax=Flavobacterium zubiriense TaxID=3138075 RepID=A0ABV4TB56_9FLAO
MSRIDLPQTFLHIGSCSSGLASNVMTYIAKGNSALSVTVTAISSLAAPIMTPFLIKIFAEAMVEV